MIHRNGTSGEVLRDEYLEQRNILEKLIRRMSENGPNMRDYYPYDDGTAIFRQAAMEHEERIRQLKSVSTDLCVLAEAVQDQMDT